MAAAIALQLAVALADDPGLALENAWIRAMPPGMKMTAGFGTLRNAGPEPIELTAYSSPQFADVSLHRSETIDGVSRMREVPSLVVAAGTRIELEPGGYHLMLMAPRAGLQPDRPIVVVMQSADGREYPFEVPVERR